MSALDRAYHGVRPWWRLSVASVRMLYRDRQALLVAFLLPLIFVFAFRLFDLRIVLGETLALSGGAGGMPSTIGYFEFVLPGLLAMAIMNFALFSVAVALTTFREQRVLARVSVTPLSPTVFLTSQLASRAALALAQVAVVLAAGFLLGMRYGAGALWLFPLAVPASLIFLNLGSVLASWSGSVTAATGMANLIALPLIFLSGVFLPVSALPGGLPNAVALLPLAPLISLMRAALLGTSGSDPLTAAMVLSAWLVATTAAAALSFRRLLGR